MAERLDKNAQQTATYLVDAEAGKCRVQIVKMRLKALGGCKPPERARELGLWDRVIPSRAHRSGLAQDLGEPRSSNIPVARSEP